MFVAVDSGCESRADAACASGSGVCSMETRGDTSGDSSARNPPPLKSSPESSYESKPAGSLLSEKLNDSAEYQLVQRDALGM